MKVHQQITRTRGTRVFPGQLWRRHELQGKLPAARLLHFSAESTLFSKFSEILY